MCMVDFIVEIQKMKMIVQYCEQNSIHLAKIFMNQIDTCIAVCTLTLAE